MYVKVQWNLCEDWKVDSKEYWKEFLEAEKTFNRWETPWWPTPREAEGGVLHL